MTKFIAVLMILALCYSASAGVVSINHLLSPGTTQAATDAWANLGTAVKTQDATSMGVFVYYDKGTGSGVQLRAIAQIDSAGALGQYSPMIDTTATNEVAVQPKVYALDNSSSLAMIEIPLGTKTSVSPYMQIQIKATTPGTCIFNKAYSTLSK